MERQVRDEDVCILVRSNGEFHLERVALGLGKTRIFEGVFSEATVADLQGMLNNDELKKISQKDIHVDLVNEDLDKLLLAVNRENGWQSLNFPSGASRKPFKNSVLPLVKWLERNMQQPHPLPPGTPTNRCMPQSGTPSRTITATGTPVEAPTKASVEQAEKNPYVLRFVEDHFQADATSTSSGTWQKSINNKTDRTCIIVYQSGRYRMEKSKQEFNSAMETEVFKDSLSGEQLQELRRILDVPDLLKFDHQTTSIGLSVKEGDTINLAIPRGTATQKLSFASYFGVRAQEAGLRDNLHTGVDAELPKIKPLRNWLKTNVESKSSPAEKNTPSTTCIPSTQPE